MVRKKPEKLSPPPPVQKWEDGKQEIKQEGKEPIYVHTIGNTKVIVQTRQYKLITPLFGGGVEPGVNDLDNLIRATEIRGQLRFWWRAIRGGQFDGDLTKMKEREDEIWGAASKTSAKNEDQTQKIEESEPTKWHTTIQIEVKVIGKGKAIEPFQVIEKDDQKNPGKKRLDAKPNDLKKMGYRFFPFYAAFPLKPTSDELQEGKKKEDIYLKTLQEDVGFVLHLSIPKKWNDEVQAALWAWETFGGIGARTRRGFGAIQREGDGQYDLPPTNRLDAEIWIKNKLMHWGANNKFPENLPHLSPDMQLYILGPVEKPISIWNVLIDKLQKYRQQRDLISDKKSGKQKSGPNKWPEAEAIRNRIPGQQLKGNNPNPPDKFPRAVFGLPIVFHFMNEPRIDNTILQGKDEKRDRLASPLILRPLGCSDNEALGLAVVLKGWSFPPGGLKLVHKRGSSGIIDSSQTQLTSSEVKGLGLKGISGEEKDALHAFINYLKEKGN